MSNKNLVGQETGHYSDRDYMVFEDCAKPQETCFQGLTFEEARLIGRDAVSGVLAVDSEIFDYINIQGRLVA